MNDLLKYKCLFLILIVLFDFARLSGQVNSVNATVNKVNSNVAKINQLAAGQQVIQAVEVLNATRRDLDNYVNYYFEEEMRKAKMEDNSFLPSLNVQISNVLTASYWEDRVGRAQRSIDLAKEAFAERNHQRTLDNQDVVWSYLKTAYGIGKTIKDVVGSVETLELYDAFKSAKEGVDDFIENYIEIENARLQIINTQLYEVQVQGLIRRGERMEEKCWQFASYMRAYEQDVNDFYAVVNRFNQKANSVLNERVINWSSPEYSWNSQKYLSEINTLVNAFKQGNFNYENLNSKIELINNRAEEDKNQVYQNIHNSGANDAFERGTKLDEDFDEFYNLSIDKLDECYNYKGDATNSDKTSSAQSINSFAGLDSLNDVKQNQNVTESDKTQLNTDPFAGVNLDQVNAGNNTQNQITESNQQQLNSNRSNLPGYVGIVENFGNGKGSFCTIEKGKINKNDRIVFHVISGQLKKVEIIWRTSGGIWRTQYEGPQKQFNAATYLNEIPEYITHLNFTVNAHHNSSYLPEACKAEVWCLSPGQSVPATIQNTRETVSAQTNTQTTQLQSQVTAPKQNVSTPVQTPAQTTPAQTSNTSKKPEKVSVAVNKMPKTGASQMARIPVYKLMENDKLVFKQTGGSLLKLWARWSGRSFSEVLFPETKQIVYSTAELMAKRPEQAMFLDFQVNQYSDVHCYLEAWVIPGGVPIPAEWNIKESGGGTNSNGNVAGANSFYDLISKADEAFNRKYWQESQGVRSSSNPKQESLDLLRKCEPIISGENDVQQRYTFVKILAGKYAEYARRVFVYSAKSDFIQLAGGLLSKYGGQISSFSDGQQKSSAYTIIAEGWRDLARAATWGDHAFNKMACDKESKRYYDLALREDRNNAQLQKTVEKINAPKKPVPAQVKSTPAIPENVWAEAENLRNMMVENVPIQKEDGPHYMEVGLVKIDLGSINVGSGKVWIWRSGAENWEEITENNQFVFIGDKIKTDENTTNVSFKYSADNTNLVIKSGSVVTFYESQIYIERGDVGLFVKKRGGKFLVITPKATTGCRGTEFTVKVDNNGNTDVHLMEGVVELRNSTEISYLVPGQAARIEKEDEEMQISTFNIQQHQQQFQPENTSRQNTNTDPFRLVNGGGKIIGGK